MPNIREYTNQDAQLHPDEMGSEAFARAGRSIVGDYNSLGADVGHLVNQVGGDFAQHEAVKDISNLSAKIPVVSQYLDQDLSKRLAGATADDQTVGDQYLQESVEPALQDLKDQATTDQGRKFMDQQIASLRQHAYEKTGAAMASRAGQQMSANLNTAQNYYTNGVAQDPRSLTTSLGLWDNQTKALLDNSPSLTPEQQSAIREHGEGVKKNLVLAAAASLIEANPDAAKTAINSGTLMGTDLKQYLDASDIEKLNTHADEVARSHAAQARADYEVQKQQAVQSNDAAAAHLIGSLVAPDGTPSVPSNFYADTRTLSNAPFITPGLVRSLQEAGKTIQDDAAKGTPTVTDPHTYNDLLSRASLPPTDPRAVSMQDIAEARANRQLNNNDFTSLKDVVEATKANPNLRDAQKVLNDFVTGQKHLITASTSVLGTVAPATDQMYADYQAHAQRMFASKMAAGESPAQAAQELTDPNSKAYLGQYTPLYQISSKGADSLARAFSSTGVFPSVTDPSRDLARERVGLPAAAVPGEVPGEPLSTTLARIGKAAPAPAAAPPPDFPKLKAGETLQQLDARIAAYRAGGH